jgi:drug/metabolite transporter (DMT)-like permease
MKLNWNEVAGYGLIVLASCFWGGSASLGKSMMQKGISTFQLMQLRSVISAVIVLVLLALFGRKHLRIRYGDLPLLLLLSLPGLALVNASYYYAIKTMPVAVAVFIQFTAPVLIFLYGWLSGKERTTRPKIIALFLCIGVTYLIVQIQKGALNELPMLGLLCDFVSFLL